MKKKLIATLLCGMLLTTSVVLAVPSQKKMMTHTETHQVAPVSDDVPIWQTGDSWTYKVDNISLNFQENNQTIYMTLYIDQLPLTVSNDAGDSYTLTFSTKASGHAIIDVDTGEGPLNMEINFDDVSVEGSIMIEKTALGIQSITATLQGLFKLIIIEWPQGQLPFSHFPIPVTINMDLGSSAPITLLSFPMETGKIWNLSAMNLTVNGDIHSIWLNIIHFVNLIFGLFEKNFLPPEIEILLPVLDIKAALDTFGIGNVFSVPGVPDIFTCGNMTQISVPAGTFDAYEIWIAEGIGSIYYAPTAGNVIKINGNFHEVIPYIQDLNMELLSTTYQP